MAGSDTARRCYLLRWHLLQAAIRITGDLLAIVTATNRFVTEPIAKALGVENLIAADAELTAEGNLTGKLLAIPDLRAKAR